MVSVATRSLIFAFPFYAYPSEEFQVRAWLRGPPVVVEQFAQRSQRASTPGIYRHEIVVLIRLLGVSRRNRAVVSRPGGWREISPLRWSGFATRSMPRHGAASLADHDGGRRSSRAATCPGVQLPPCIVATPRAARARAIALSIALLLIAASGGFRARISRWITRMIGNTVAA
jgi:hypothetical protein